MPDNLGYTPGSGSKAATREATYSGETAHVQIVGVATVVGPDDGKTVTDVSATNPMPVQETGGELLDAIEALRFAVASLTKSIGFALPNVQGFPIMEARQATAANLNVTATVGSGTVTTVSTLTNQSQMGGFATQDYIPALMHMQADNLRRNISVT